MSYLLQEIYGIENKNNQETKVKVPSSSLSWGFPACTFCF